MSKTSHIALSGELNLHPVSSRPVDRDNAGLPDHIMGGIMRKVTALAACWLLVLGSVCLAAEEGRLLRFPDIHKDQDNRASTRHSSSPDDDRKKMDSIVG